jgi:hypothetical protein
MDLNDIWVRPGICKKDLVVANMSGSIKEGPGSCNYVWAFENTSEPLKRRPVF